MRETRTLGNPLKILPTQNPVIFNNFFLVKDAFATIIYRKKKTFYSSKYVIKKKKNRQ